MNKTETTPGSLSAAVGLVALIGIGWGIWATTASIEPETWAPPAGEVSTIVAKCETAAGDLGVRLAAIDKGASPVEAYQVATEAESTCHESAAGLSRAGQVSDLVKVCGGFAQVGEVTASAAKSALDDPRPGTLASLEQSVAILALERSKCRESLERESTSNS